MSTKTISVQLPDGTKATIEIEETMIVQDIVENLKSQGLIDNEKHFVVKTASGYFVPNNLDFHELHEKEIVIIESQVPMANFGGEDPKNDPPRCLVILVIDVSGSMFKAMPEVNKGLQLFADEIRLDAVARQRIEVAIITFSDIIKVVQEPALVDDFSMPTLSANGTTKMVDGMRTAINYVETRKRWYSDNSLKYYRPHILLITDGEPDSDQDVIGLADEIKAGGIEKHFELMPVAVIGANKQVLDKIAQTTYKPAPLQGYEFTKLFKWLSNSMSTLSKSSGKENVAYSKPDWKDKDEWANFQINQT
jgi:uncharacterized protein YegL